MKPIGKKFLRHEMQIVPKQVKLLAYYTVTYACDQCEKDTGFAHIISVKPPVPLIKHSSGFHCVLVKTLTSLTELCLPLLPCKLVGRNRVLSAHAQSNAWLRVET